MSQEWMLLTAAWLLYWIASLCWSDWLATGFLMQSTRFSVGSSQLYLILLMLFLYINERIFLFFKRICSWKLRLFYDPVQLSIQYNNFPALVQEQCSPEVRERLFPWGGLGDLILHHRIKHVPQWKWLQHCWNVGKDWALRFLQAECVFHQQKCQPSGGCAMLSVYPMKLPMNMADHLVSRLGERPCTPQGVGIGRNWSGREMKELLGREKGVQEVE